MNGSCYFSLEIRREFSPAGIYGPASPYGLFVTKGDVIRSSTSGPRYFKKSQELLVKYDSMSLVPA